MAQSTHAQSISFGGSNARSGNPIARYKTTVYEPDEDARIMRWLSPLEPNNTHQSVRIDRFNGVGDWLLETSEFREWSGGEGGADKAVLFCSGNPGVGKTYLCSLVVDSLCDQARKEDVAVACLYLDFLVQQEQTIANMMGAILKQLVARRGITKDLREAFIKGQKEFGGRGLLLAELIRILMIAIASLPQVIICIDGLDECIPKHLQGLLKSLREIVRECPTTRIFLTGRPHVKEDIQRYFITAVVIPISLNTNDIRNYLRMRLDGDVDPEAMNDELRADIIRFILERISDVFLLVSLNMDAILGEVTISTRRKKLEEITRGKGLSDAYAATIARLRAQKGNKSVLGMKVLMWVSYSERPLRAKELCYALGVEMGSSDLDLQIVPALRTLLASCLGLVTIEASSSTVRLVHFTLQEHLASYPALFHRAHSEIAETCLTYLNFGSARDVSPILDSATSTMPLLEYASCYWGNHARMGMTENAKILALRLLDRFDEHISTQIMLLGHNIDLDGHQGPRGFTGLHGAAFLGVAELVSAVLEMREWDVNATDCMGGTALIWATRRGHKDVVKILLKREDVNPGRADTKYGRTPLSWAAECGHEGIVHMLLQREDVNPDHEDHFYGRRPLSWAAKNGHEGVVNMLLGQEGINPDQGDTRDSRTPLSWGAESGHEGVVRMLLERKEVNPNHADTRYGRTPLSWAAETGREGVVRLLLERKEVNPDHADTLYGRTPLSWAAESGHEAVIKMLLERKEVNPDHTSTQGGRAPLSWAAEKGNRGVVRILLERADVNPDRADGFDGRRPLSWAAKNGHEGVVRVLLEQEDVDPDKADTRYGRTALSWGAESGHEGVVKMLLEREEVNPDRADTRYGRTPLSWAAETGREGVVRMLLDREDVNPNTTDAKYGGTPLSWASWSGSGGVVKILLDRQAGRTTTRSGNN